MPDHGEGGKEIIDGDHNGGKPADGVAADGIHISIEPVQDIAIGIFADREPVRVDDLIKNIRLDIVVDKNTEAGGDPADQAPEQKAEQRTADHNDQQQGETVRLVPRHDINGILARHTADKAQRSTDNSQHSIKQDRPFVFPAV